MSILKRIYKASVWSRSGVSATNWRFRNQFRITFPYVDLMFIWFGCVGWMNGIQSVEDAAGNNWQTTWSAAIAVCGVLALVGVAFPRLWAVELLGKIPLVGLVCGYLALQMTLGADNPRLQATAGLFTTLVAFPIWRVGDITAYDLRPWFLAWKQRRANR